MKRAIFSLLTVFMLIGLVGCVGQHGRRSMDYMGGCCAQPADTGCCAQCGDNGQCCEDSGDGCCAGLRRCGHRGKWFRDPCCEECCEGCEGGYGAPAGGTGAVAYPYYTTRGPRDFLANNPPSIGP